MATILLELFYLTSNVSRFKLTCFYCCVLLHIASLSRKLVKIAGSSESLEPPGYGPGQINEMNLYQHLKAIQDRLIPPQQPKSVPKPMKSS